MERKRVSISIDLFSRVSGISNQVIKKERERERDTERNGKICKFK